MCLYYAHARLPAGSSDDVRGVHGRGRGLGVVGVEGEVGVVLLHVPERGVPDGALQLQLKSDTAWAHSKELYWPRKLNIYNVKQYNVNVQLIGKITKGK
jgi:hypothetical protein